MLDGAHVRQKLEWLLNGFIRLFVLCGGCKQPGTELVVRALERAVELECHSCGACVRACACARFD